MCNLYVNNLGDVCLRSFMEKKDENKRRDAPQGGVVFAKVQWTSDFSPKEDARPAFQDVRGGVCAMIHDPDHIVVEPRSPLSFYHQSTTSFRIPSERKHELQLPLDDLIRQKNDLYDQLARLIKAHMECLPEKRIEGHKGNGYCGSCFKLPGRVEERDRLRHQIGIQDALILGKHHKTAGVNPIINGIRSFLSLP
jgi:hypothetical protein